MKNARKPTSIENLSAYSQNVTRVAAVVSRSTYSGSLRPIVVSIGVDNGKPNRK